jgi:twitching motility two-component system response regulator PilH
LSTILIVDDAQTDRDLMCQVVSRSGHRVITASNGKEALELAKLHKPTLIFLDVVMPVADGYATCRNLTRDPETTGIPVVLVTSKANESDIFWGKKQGAVDHVAKPWDKGTIESLINKYCP